MLRRTHRYKYLDAVAMVSGFAGVPIEVLDRTGYSVLANWVESVAALGGTIKLEASNNYDPQNTLMVANPALATWTEITGSSVTVAGSGSYGWNVSDAYYAFVRVVFAATAGAGAATAWVCVKD